MPRRRTDYGAIFPYVLGQVREGVRVTEGRRGLREAGLRFTDAVYSRVYREAVERQARWGPESTAPLDRRPGGDRIVTTELRLQQRYGQYARVLIQDRRTGEVREQPYLTLGSRLRSRGEVVDEAVEVYGSGAQAYDETVLGAVYAGTLASR